MANLAKTITTSSTDLAISWSIHFLSITNTGSFPIYLHIGDTGTAVVGEWVALLSNGSSFWYESGTFYLGAITAIASGGSSTLAISYL